MRTVERTSVPSLSTDQMREVDRAMIEDYHITLIQMMENAGLHLARLARALFLDGDPAGRRVVVLAGTGGNGGGALVAARRLHTWGAALQVIVTQPPGALALIPAHQLDILRRMQVPVAAAEGIRADLEADVILDGIIGYSLSGNPRGAAADLIRWANTHDAPVLSLDVPSGVDTTSGTVYDPAILAAATLTLALPKTGLLVAGTQVGELYLADISVPPGLYAALDPTLDPGPLFATSTIVRLA